MQTTTLTTVPATLNLQAESLQLQADSLRSLAQSFQTEADGVRQGAKEVIADLRAAGSRMRGTPSLSEGGLFVGEGSDPLLDTHTRGDQDRDALNLYRSNLVEAIASAAGTLMHVANARALGLIGRAEMITGEAVRLEDKARILAEIADELSAPAAPPATAGLVALEERTEYAFLTGEEFVGPPAPEQVQATSAANPPAEPAPAPVLTPEAEQAEVEELTAELEEILGSDGTDEGDDEEGDEDAPAETGAEALVKATYPDAVASPIQQGSHGTKWQILATAGGKSGRRISGRFATPEGAWTSALDRLTR